MIRSGSSRSMFQKGAREHRGQQRTGVLFESIYPVNPCFSVLSVKSVVRFAFQFRRSLAILAILAIFPNSSASSVPPRFKSFCLPFRRSLVILAIFLIRAHPRRSAVSLYSLFRSVSSVLISGKVLPFRSRRSPDLPLIRVTREISGKVLFRSDQRHQR